ncbi:MAG: hypothetical protein LIO63_00780 [Akkermansia sp.]|nr:hypothetical protein [Akkermansia sp.]
MLVSIVMAQSELLVEVVRIQKNPKIAEVTGDGWSFIRIPREEIENSKPLPLEKLKSSGIYFLIGIDWGGLIASSFASVRHPEAMNSPSLNKAMNASLNA